VNSRQEEDRREEGDDKRHGNAQPRMGIEKIVVTKNLAYVKTVIESGGWGSQGKKWGVGGRDSRENC